jgi:arylsulfatase A-like enzyme
MNRRLLLTIAGGILLLVALAYSMVDVSIPSRPMGDVSDIRKLRERKDLNVVFLLVDTLRADHLSAYGYARNTSPTLTDIAASGIRFANVEAQSTWTKCSMASLWTGLYPTKTGVVRFRQALPQEAQTPAEIFREAGYVTSGLWRNGWVGPNFGLGQGFDQYVSPVPRSEPQGFQREAAGAKQLAGTDLDITNAAIEFVNAHKSSRFFFYGHYMDVHQYAYDELAAAQGYGASLMDSYDAAIHWTDRNIYALLAELDRLELLEKTVVVVASDHGEAFREHGIEGHARDLYAETTHTPWILMLPFRLDQPIVVEPLVRNVDVWPTILDLVGLPPLPDSDGVSLVPLIEAAGRGEPVSTAPSFAYLDRAWSNAESEPFPTGALRQPDGKRVIRYELPESKIAFEVFDRATDPGEQKNLEPEAPEWAAALKGEVEQRLAEPPRWSATEVNVEELQAQQLRALGYLVK